MHLYVKTGETKLDCVVIIDILYKNFLHFIDRERERERSPNVLFVFSVMYIYFCVKTRGTKARIYCHYWPSLREFCTSKLEREKELAKRILCVKCLCAYIIRSLKEGEKSVYIAIIEDPYMKIVLPKERRKSLNEFSVLSV